MEADDFLADEVQVSRPEFFKFFRVVDVARRRQVVCQGVEPDVYDVLRVPGHLDAPVEGRAGYAQVFEAALDEGDHFVAPRFGLDEIGIFFDEFQPAVGVFIHFQEVGFFLDQFEGTAAVRADVLSFRQLVFRPEGFAGRAVPAGVFALVDVAVVVGNLHELLYDLFVPFFRRADEVVVGNVELFPELLEEGDDFVDVFDRFDAFGFGGTLDFLAVFVRAGQEKDVVAAEAVETGQRVGDGRAVRMPDVQLGAGVVDGSRNVIGLLFSHEFFSSYAGK